MSKLNDITLRRIVDKLTDEYIQSLQAENERLRAELRSQLRAELFKAEQRAEQ